MYKPQLAIIQSIEPMVYSIKSNLLADRTFDPILISIGDFNPSYYDLLYDEVDTLFKKYDIHGVWHGNGPYKDYSISVEDANKYSPKQSVLVKLTK